VSKEIVPTARLAKSRLARQLEPRDPSRCFLRVYATSGYPPTLTVKADGPDDVLGNPPVSAKSAVSLFRHSVISAPHHAGRTRSLLLRSPRRDVPASREDGQWVISPLRAGHRLPALRLEAVDRRSRRFSSQTRCKITRAKREHLDITRQEPSPRPLLNRLRGVVAAIFLGPFVVFQELNDRRLLQASGSRQRDNSARDAKLKTSSFLRNSFPLRPRLNRYERTARSEGPASAGSLSSLCLKILDRSQEAAAS